MSEAWDKSKGNIVEFAAHEFTRAVSSRVKWVIKFKRLTCHFVCFPLKQNGKSVGNSK